MSEEFKVALLEMNYEGTTIPCPIEEGHRLVPVKTVCQVIDVDFKRQDSWLKKHEYFSQLYNPGYTVGADGKQREMNCLPIFDLLSWLSSISSNQRKEGSESKQYAFMAWLRKEMLSMYKLIEVFQQENKYELELVESKDRALDQLIEAQNQVKSIKDELKKIDKSIEEVRATRFTSQTVIPFPNS